MIMSHHKAQKAVRIAKLICHFGFLALGLLFLSRNLSRHPTSTTHGIATGVQTKLYQKSSSTGSSFTIERVCAGVRTRLQTQKGLRFALSDVNNIREVETPPQTYRSRAPTQRGAPPKFRFPIDIRLHYTQTHEDVAQGSFVIQPVLALLAELTKVQTYHLIEGAIGEIGVHHGKFFVGLAHLAKNHEKLWACDVFEDQALNVDGSGFGDRSAFERACQSNGIGNEDVDVNSGGSADITQLPYRFRLFSVDGGHTRELTVNDLTVAASHLEEGGIIILDDITNLAWPGVIDGFFTWMSYFPQRYAPFFVGYNKVFITQERYHKLFYDTLVQYAANAPEGMRLSIEPGSNTNPHKSKDSGPNQFKWSGYAFVWGDNTVNVTTATSEWTKAIS